MRALFVCAILCGSVGSALATAEICGNGIDDDGNGLTDEGCYPTMTTGVCESPLSCTDTGMVSWSTGSLHYELPPDVSPVVPFGPGIGFRRFYMSMYTPGSNPSTVNHSPMGPGWQHTYMTWVYPYTISTTNYLLHHTSQGRDVLYTKTGSDATYDLYTPQPGDHVLSMKLRRSDSFVFLQLLTGETLVFNASGQISEIWDTVSPTPNKVTIAWSGINVSTVTDASGMKRLSFNYTNNLLTSLDYQFQTSVSTWTTEHTTTYDYGNYVSKDATSGWFVPANATEWTNLLSGSGIATPSHAWQMQETSGSLSDSIGSTSLTASGTGGTYHATISGWTRKAVTFTDGSTGQFSSASTLCNPASSSCTSMALVATAGPPAAERTVMDNGGTNGNRATLFPSGSSAFARDRWGSTAFAQATFPGTRTGVAPWIISTNSGTSTTFGQFSTTSATPTWSSVTATGTFSLGGGAPAGFLYAAEWSGTALTTTQTADLVNRITKGPGLLTTVTIGGQLAQKNSYVAGYLATITDAAGIPLNAFSYSSTVAGQVDLITTPRGTVGFEFSSTRTGCTGKTMLYFNQGNTSSCSIDSDCGTGFMCGGKTGTGSTGKCFLAGRCLTTTASVSGETVVTDVAPIGPGGGSCDGACTDVAKYTWPAVSGVVSPIAKQDAMTTADFTSITYNSNGLPTQIGYGDTDSDPTNGGTNRTVYYFYDTTYPGRLVEIRRPSDLSTGCSAASSTGCKRTLYSYGTDQQLHTVTESGYTLSSTNTVTTYSNVDTYTYDSNGRISEIDGPVSGIKTTFDYNPITFTSAFASGHLQDAKIYTDATHYLEPFLGSYDFWGHPTALTDPNGNYTCDTYDPARSTLTQRRRAMAGQTSCSTPNSADLTIQWTRDSAQRLTKLKRPDTGCEFYSYDSAGRLGTIRRRDDCEIASAGDWEVFSYTADNQISEIDTTNSSLVITRKDLFAYYASRKLQKIFNPASPTNFKGYVFDAAGRQAEVDGEGSLSKTVNNYAGAPGRDGRITSVDEYKTTSTSDSWSLLYAWDGAQSQVTDGDSKVTGSTRDDLGRIVRLSSPDFTGNTIRVYDAASNLTSVIEDQGGTGQQTHTFTFDSLNRPLNNDYYGTCSVSGAGVAHAEIQRYYDSLPTGVTCPLSSCSNTKGHLAYVVTTLMCSSTYATTDGALDQKTFFAYDAAGHLIEEYTVDDAGRSADTAYTYANGLLTRVALPSGHPINWAYDSSNTTNNSDVDRVTSIKYNTVETIADQVQWNPFGPWSQYNWQASIGGTALRSRVARDLAYRITGVYEAEYQTGSSSNDQITIGRDVMGRVTSRVYSPHDPTLPGLFDSYFLYDEQNRVICETTSSVSSCPTTGSSIKNSMSLSPPFTNAGDWKRVLRPSPGTTGLTNDFNTSGTAYGTSHQVTDLNQSDGTPTLGHTAYGYDVRGNRSYDDNTTTLTHDRRDYTYDARRNVTNVRGQMYVSGAWHYYDVASAFDHRNRRVFKSLYDETTGKTAQWFFYYDVYDRLTEIDYTPDVSTPSTLSYYHVVWLGSRVVAFVQVDIATGTVSKRYATVDETSRIEKLWNYPSSGNATIVWDVNQSAWGRDVVLTNSAFQPFLFSGQYVDAETVSLMDDGATVHRNSVVLNGYRTYDSMLGAYLQVDPLVEQTFSSYTYAHSDPVGNSDPDGALDGEIIVVTGTAPKLGKADCGIEGWCFPDPPNPCDILTGSCGLGPPHNGPGTGHSGNDGGDDPGLDTSSTGRHGCNDVTCQTTFAHYEGDYSESQRCLTLKAGTDYRYNTDSAACATAYTLCQTAARNIPGCQMPDFDTFVYRCDIDPRCGPHPDGRP